MRTQTQSKVKPSQVHQDPELLRQMAAESNRKRQERKREQAREEARKEAEELARQEREREEARIREEEAKMWESVQPKTESKSEKKVYRQGKIKTMVDGIEFDSLAKGMAYIDPILWGKENDYRTSHWIKINRALKKNGSVVYMGHEYKLI